MSLKIREASVNDVPLILEFIKALADYEKLSQDVVATTETLKTTLFGERPFAECLIAEWHGKPAAFALFFHNYSTFLAKPGLYLEDLFVQPEFRKFGIGKAMLQKLAGIAIDRNCGRFEWSVLDWNQPAIDFYLKLGAKPMNEWTVFRIESSELERLAASAPR